jgi:hypothetical protein
MKNKIFHIILSLTLLFIDINQIALPYIAFVIGYMVFMLNKKQFNELVLALPLFGYSFGLFINKFSSIPNLIILLVIISFLLVFRLLVGYVPFKKLQLVSLTLNSMYFIFGLMILFSLFGIFSLQYPFFKLQLLVLWVSIFLISINLFDDNIINFNFENFLIISSLLFIPHFSNAKFEGSTLSPKQVWETFSVLDDGIRGYDFDIISATRIAGIGILAYIIFLLDFSRKKAYLTGYLLCFFIMLIICQTRQSIVALFLPIFLYFIYSVYKYKKNYFGLFVGFLFVIYSVFSYVQYTKNKGVESRIVTSVEGSSSEGTGREYIWNSAFNYINTNGSATGFGNFNHFTHTHNYPHNIFLEVYIEIGVIATFLIIFIIIYIIAEVYKVFFVYKDNSKLELFLIFSTLYFLGLAQFSVDISRNLTFFYTFALFVFIKNYKIKMFSNESTT